VQEWTRKLHRAASERTEAASGGLPRRKTKTNQPTPGSRERVDETQRFQRFGLLDDDRGDGVLGVG
jgi:hypothetical protein